MASSLSSGVGYLFESFQSIWLKIAQHLVVNFVVFRRGVELLSFYSAILIPRLLSPSPFNCFFFFFFFFFWLARGQIGDSAASLHHSHSNMGSKPHASATYTTAHGNTSSLILWGKARDCTCNFMVPSRIRFCCAMMGTPAFLFLFLMGTLVACENSWVRGQSRAAASACATVKATPDPSCICDLYCRLWQH